MRTSEDRRHGAVVCANGCNDHGGGEGEELEDDGAGHTVMNQQAVHFLRWPGVDALLTPRLRALLGLCRLCLGLEAAAR